MSTNPTPADRFAGRAEAYSQSRPGYPEAVYDDLLEVAGLGPRGVVADIGSGTGIFAAGLRRRGLRVIAVEPNAEMRAYAGDDSVDGTAEATTLARGSVDLVTAAQAFHWFDPPRARQEFVRITRGAHPVALVWNERRLAASPFDHACDALFARFVQGRDSVAAGRSQARSDEAIARFFAPSTFGKRTVPNSQALGREAFVGRLESISFMPKRGTPAHAELAAAADEVFARYAVNDVVTLAYDTDVNFGKLS